MHHSPASHRKDAVVRAVVDSARFFLVTLYSKNDNFYTQNDELLGRKLKRKLDFKSASDSLRSLCPIPSEGDSERHEIFSFAGTWGGVFRDAGHIATVVCGGHIFANKHWFALSLVVQGHPDSWLSSGISFVRIRSNFVQQCGFL